MANRRPMSVEPVYRWTDHATMAARPRSYFLDYWTTMTRPIPAKAAAQLFRDQVRVGGIVVVHAPALPVPAALAQSAMEF